MKTCPNPNCKTTGIPDEAKFCPVCGNVLETYSEITPRFIYKRVLYYMDNEAMHQCEVRICSNRIWFKPDDNAYARVIKYSDITNIGILKGANFPYKLCIRTQNGCLHHFLGEHRYEVSSLEFVKKIAYIIEYYRRLLLNLIPVGGFANSEESIASISNENLIDFYNSL